MKSTILRISLALVFCLGIFVSANPAAMGQRDRGERGNRDRCQKECKKKYKEQVSDCKSKRGKGERRECKERASKELRECQDRCRH
jgi:hypothetical protein